MKDFVIDKVIYKKIDSDITYIRLNYLAGSFNDPKKLYGLSHLLEHLMFAGNSENISKLDKLGVSCNAHTGYDIMSFEFYFLTSDLPEVLDIIQDFMSNPTFNQDLLDKEKTIVIDEYLSSRRDPSEYFSDEFTKYIYPNSGYAHDITGNEETVDQISLDDITDFYDKYLKPSNAWLTVFSSNDDLSVFDVLGFDYKDKFTISYPEQDLSLQQTIVVKLPQTDALYFAQGFELKGFTIKDYIFMQILYYLLGGSFNSLLFENIRKSLGNVYSVHADTMVCGDNLLLLASAQYPEDADPNDYIFAMNKSFRQLFGKDFLKSKFNEAIKAVNVENLLIKDSIKSLISYSVYATSIGYSVDLLTEPLSSLDFEEFYSFVKRCEDSEFIQVLSELS